MASAAQSWLNVIGVKNLAVVLTSPDRIHVPHRPHTPLTYTGQNSLSFRSCSNYFSSILSFAVPNKVCLARLGECTSYQK